MARRVRKQKCRNCGEFFLPDYRNVDRQKYCRKDECKKASKAASQKRWLAKPENQDYFKGEENVRRVQLWREDHPGYAKRKPPKSQEALQDSCRRNTKQFQDDRSMLIDGALQDFCSPKGELLLGLIATLTDCTLQDDIAAAALKMKKLGQDILNPPHLFQGGVHDPKESFSQKQAPKGPQTV
jgi:hypothetical protein